ncbi:MAG: carboxymuconolactone decarboxylase family protein [Dehalococcoidia bacterium]|nr:carboxymuconolactone decarboxylase family protein [Dehalococcoidia bacterium]
MVRLPEFMSKEDLSQDQRPVFATIVEKLGRMRLPFSILLNSPEVAGAVFDLAMRLKIQPKVPAEDRETAILTVARELDCEYEWSQHVEIALRAGVREEVIDAIAHRCPLDAFTKEQALIVAYVRELIQGHRISDATFEAARARYGNDGLTDLTAKMAIYVMLTCFFNAFGVEAPPDTPLLP